MDNLSNKKCIPCEGNVRPFTKSQYSKYKEMVNNWKIIDDKSIEKNFKFKNFNLSLKFINQIGEIAESEGHHPDLYLHNWNKVRVTLTTHSIGGLSINDFILASKIDLLEKQG